MSGFADFYSDGMMVLVPQAPSAYDYAEEGGYTGTEAEFARRMAFLMNGTVVGYVEGSSIVLSGDLAPGTYTFVYALRKDDGTTETAAIGTYTVEETAEIPEPDPATYTVTWVNHDGTVLETDTVAEGETPVYNGATPIKAADSAYTYTFSGWTPALVPATEDAVYTAVFEKTAIEVEPAYTNLLTAAGYKKDYKISVSSGTEASSVGAYASGFIPIQDVTHEFYIKNITLSSAASVNNVVFYDTARTKLTGSAGTAGAFTSNVYDEGNGVYSLKPSRWAGTAEAAFFRFSCGGMTAESIVTENQPL